MKIKFQPTVVTHDGEDYLELQHIDIQVQAKKYLHLYFSSAQYATIYNISSRMYTNFENLFQNKAISDNANSLMNESQEALFAEIRQSYGKARSVVLLRLLKPAFLKYPYRMWFKEV